MRIRGINFDTGFISAGSSTREPFDPAIVKQEMRIIHDDLHCNGVRITGGHPERLEIAASYAAEAGLEVWFCPFTNNLTADETIALVADCAARAERLRRTGAEVVFVAGSELSLMTSGILPGATLPERMGILTDPLQLRAVIPNARARMKDLLGRIAEAARTRFGGKLSYASVPLDGVDWGLFDIIATDAGYRTLDRAARFRDDIRAFVAQGRAQRKPVAVTEFGCASHSGASSLMNSEDSMIEWGNSARPVRLKGAFWRDENEQAGYIRELLDTFETEGVDAAFVYTFARYDMPHGSEADQDFDLVSKGIVKVLEGSKGKCYPDMPWEPKAAFDAVAEYYRALRERAIGV